jgi:hypothetical protein
MMKMVWDLLIIVTLMTACLAHEDCKTRDATPLSILLAKISEIAMFGKAVE